MNALIFDPGTSSTIYVATQNGVFKSTDAGQNWVWCNNGFSYDNVWALAISPNATNTIYAGGSRVFKSIDGGSSWQSKGQFPNIRALAVDPANSSLVYAGTQRFISGPQLAPSDSLIVTVQAAGITLPVENVGTVTGVMGLNASYIVVRLPDGLPAGELPLTVAVAGVTNTNPVTLRISP